LIFIKIYSKLLKEAGKMKKIVLSTSISSEAKRKIEKMAK